MLGSVNPDLYSGIYLQSCVLYYYTILWNNLGHLEYCRCQPGRAILLGRKESGKMLESFEIVASQQGYQMGIICRAWETGSNSTNLRSNNVAEVFRSILMSADYFEMHQQKQIR